MSEEIGRLSPRALLSFLENKTNKEIEDLFSSGALKFPNLDIDVLHFIVRRKVFSVKFLLGKVQTPKTTLYYWAKGRNSAETKKRLLSSEELAIIEWSDCLSKRGFQVSKELICSKARSLCPDPNFKATKWWCLFRRRHPEFVRRRREFLGKLRARSISKEGVSAYFDLVKNEIANVKLIANIDETGVEVNCHSRYTFCRRGAKNVPATCQDRGPHITAVGCIFHDKSCLPPYFIFTGKRVSPALKALAPVSVSENGWMTDSVMLDFLQWFIQHIPAIRPILLIWDGLTSHTQNPEVLEILARNNIICISLPPHSSHITQPLDKAVYGPLKSAFGKELDTWNRENPTSTLSRKEFVAVFSKAWDVALSRENIGSAFQATGLHPFDPSVVLQKFDGESANSTFGAPPPRPTIIDDDHSDQEGTSPGSSSGSSRIINDDETSSEEYSDDGPSTNESSPQSQTTTTTSSTTADSARIRELETEIAKLRDENTRNYHELIQTRKELQEKKRHGRLPKKLRSKRLRIETKNVEIPESPESVSAKPASPSTFRGHHCRSPEAASILSLPEPVSTKPKQKKRGRKCRPAALLTSPEYIQQLKTNKKKK